MGGLAAACDPNHKDKCEWYLVPEPKFVDVVPEGYVSLCARNYVVNKQKCHMKGTLEFSKAVFGKTFRYSSLRIDDKGLYPREVLGIKTCKPEEAELQRQAKQSDK